MAQDVERAQQRLRRAESLVRFVESGLASGSTNQNELRIAQAKYEAARLDLFDAEQAAAGTPPENSAPASNPTPEPPAINTRVEQLEPPSGVPDTPEDTGYSDPFAEGGDVQDIGEETIVRSPEDSNLADDPVVNEYDEFGDIEERDLNAPPEPQEDAPSDDPVVNEYDEFSDIERDIQNPEPTPTDDEGYPGDDPFAEESFEPVRQPAPVEEEIDFDDEEDVVDFPEEEKIAQSNSAALEQLKKQGSVQQQRRQEGTGDWRVKLRLASGADYFYNSIAQSGDDVERTAGILQPLYATDGIVFPYTPSIQILYAAEYNQYQPTHSNYQNYFYKGSKVGEVVLTASFTAQDTEEANYLLAVVHFLKSASKMFYGQDQERGSPPPLLFLTGLGEYQFNEAPCLISQFNYVLPDNVDYIRANTAQIGSNDTLQSNLRNKNTGGRGASRSSSINRLRSSNLFKGAENPVTKMSNSTANLSSDTATYMPTKMEITITLLPVQNRLQVSQDFSLKQYADGTLIKRGFW